MLKNGKFVYKISKSYLKEILAWSYLMNKLNKLHLIKPFAGFLLSSHRNKFLLTRNRYLETY